ncbi:MAG: hypothetical protein IJU45_08160, partial [Clostridia bacterium]|nr:hypothetical protein [Clostridia bacterium]
MTKIFKRTLSVLLAVILVATTFFIFDPSVLNLKSDAFVDTEGNTVTSLSKQTAYAPETVWLTPGGTGFKYFANFNSATGSVISATDTSGVVSFSNADATNVKIGVNKIYEKGSTSMFSGTLKIGGTTVNTKANKTATNATDMNTFTAVATGTNSASVTMTSSNSSLTGTTAGTVYFIEWIVRYVIDGTAHFTYMYTAVYPPVLGQAGMTYHSAYTGGTLTSDVNHRAYSFITGAHAYGGGNRTSAFTSETVKNFYNNNNIQAPYTAPLISFVGIKNNSTNYTIPGGETIWNSTTYFPEQANGGVLTGNRTFSSNENDYGHFTIWTNYGTFANPTPSGTAYGAYGGGASFDYNLSGTTTGVAYINADISRFSNYNQIPYLSAGWVEFYHHWCGSSNCIDRIQAIETFTSNNNWATNGSDVEDFVKGRDNRNIADPINCNVDSGDFECESKNSEDNKSLARGLYPFNGNVRSGFVTIGYGARNGYSALWGAETESCYVLSTVGLYTATVDKSSLRTTYSKALGSNIDYANCQTASQNYTNFYNQLKASGEALCDPTNTGTSANATLAGYVRDYGAAISNAKDSAVYFYVPEIIYLNPIIDSSSRYTFQYFVDRDNSDNSNLRSAADNTSGNVYFNSTNASTVSISASGTDCSVSISTSSGTDSISTTCSGYSTTYTNKTITWTATFVERDSGQTKTVNAYSYVYAPFVGTSSIISTSSNTGYNGGTWHDDAFLGTTAWIVGIHTVDASWYNPTSASAGSTYSGGDITNDSKGDADGYGGYNGANYLTNNSYSVPTSGKKNIQSVYTTSRVGGSGYWSSDSDVNWSHGGKGTIYVDSSRYTNLNQIPDLYAGMDLNYNEKGSGGMYLYSGWYSSNLYPETNLLTSATGQGTGAKLTPQRIAGAFEHNTTTTNTLIIHGKSVKSGAHSNKTGRASCYLVTYFRNKTNLRSAYDYAVKSARFLQQDYFTSTAWNNFTSYRSTVAGYLENPASTASQSDMDSAATNLYNQVAAMVGAVTAEAGSSTFSYKKMDNTTASNQTRSNYVKTSTAKVYHRVVRSSSTSYPLFKAVSEYSLVNYEEKTYYYGENVITGFNNPAGYTHLGYRKGADLNSPSGYTTGETHTDYYVHEDNLSYTYFYNLIPEVTFDNQ